MGRVKDENYYQICGWMTNKLKLKGVSLNTFAIIYGFTQDGETEFKGSLNYMSEFLGVSKPTVIKAINELIEKNFITKEERSIKNVKQNIYKANLDVVKNFNWGSKETLLGGSKETLPNNNTNNNYYKENIIKESQSDSKTQSISIEQTYSINALTKENIIPLEQTYLDEYTLSGKQILSNDSAIKDIFNYWNNLNIVVHKKISNNIENIISKALKDYSVEEIKSAMSNYNTVLKDKDYYFDYIWGIDTFLKQKNCLPHFVDSGEKWLSYCKKKGIAEKGKQHTEYKIDESGVISL